MAITESAKKAIRQSAKREKQNSTCKDKIKRLIKEARVLVSAKKISDAQKLLPQVYKALDKAAKVGVIKKNNASRRKSRLTKLISKN